MLAIDISCRFLSVTKGISIQVARPPARGLFGIDMCTLLSSQGASAHQNLPNLATRPKLGQPDEHYTRVLGPAQRGSIGGLTGGLTGAARERPPGTDAGLCRFPRRAVRCTGPSCAGSQRAVSAEASTAPYVRFPRRITSHRP